jgi:hypothetical protein
MKLYKIIGENVKMPFVDEHLFGSEEKAKRRRDYIEKQKRDLREGIEAIDRYSQCLAAASSLDHELIEEERSGFEQAALDINRSTVGGMADSNSYVSFHNFNRAGMMAYFIQDYAGLKRRLKEAIEQKRELGKDFFDDFESLLYTGKLSQNGLFDAIDENFQDESGKRHLTLSEIAKELEECDVHAEEIDFRERYEFVLKSGQMTKQDLVEAFAKQMAYNLYSKLVEIDSDLEEENMYKVIDELYQRIMHAAKMEKKEAESKDPEKMGVKEGCTFIWGRELNELSDEPNPEVLYLLLRSKMSEGEQLIFDYFSLRRMSEDKEGVEEMLREELGEAKAEEIMSDLRGDGVEKQLEIILDSWHEQNVVRYQEHIEAGLEYLRAMRGKLEYELENLRENGHKAPGKVKSLWTADKKVKAAFVAGFAGVALFVGSNIVYSTKKGCPVVRGSIAVRDDFRLLKTHYIPVGIYDNDKDGDLNMVEVGSSTLATPEFMKEHPIVSWLAGAKEISPKDAAYFSRMYKDLAKEEVEKIIAKIYNKHVKEAKEKGKEPLSVGEWLKARPKFLGYLVDPTAGLHSMRNCD